MGEEWGVWCKTSTGHVEALWYPTRERAEDALALGRKHSDPSVAFGPVQRRSDPNPFECRVSAGPRDEEVREFAYDRAAAGSVGTCPACGRATPQLYACHDCFAAHRLCCCGDCPADPTGAIAVRDRIYAHAKRLRDEAGMRPIRGVGGKVIGHAQPAVTLHPVQPGLTVTLERAVGVGQLAELLHATDPRVLAFVADRSDPGVTVAKVWARNERGWRAEAEERTKRMVEVMSKEGTHGK